MAVEEIFRAICEHMCKGIRMHQQMIEIYDFLALEGYKKCQEFHYFSELIDHQRVKNYYTTHYIKLLKEGSTENENIISQTWYKYTKMDVDTSTRKNSIKENMKRWVEWEQDTKLFLQSMHQELEAIHETAAALFVQTLILDVSQELVEAQNELLRLEVIGYDMVEIGQRQDKYVEDFDKRIKKLYKGG